MKKIIILLTLVFLIFSCGENEIKINKNVKITFMEDISSKLLRNPQINRNDIADFEEYFEGKENEIKEYNWKYDIKNIKKIEEKYNSRIYYDGFSIYYKNKYGVGKTKTNGGRYKSIINSNYFIIGNLLFYTDYEISDDRDLVEKVTILNNIEGEELKDLGPHYFKINKKIFYKGFKYKFENNYKINYDYKYIVIDNKFYLEQKEYLFEIKGVDINSIKCIDMGTYCNTLIDNNNRYIVTKSPSYKSTKVYRQSKGKIKKLKKLKVGEKVFSENHKNENYFGTYIKGNKNTKKMKNQLVDLYYLNINFPSRYYININDKNFILNNTGYSGMNDDYLNDQKIYNITEIELGTLYSNKENIYRLDIYKGGEYGISWIDDTEGGLFEVQ